MMPSVNNHKAENDQIPRRAAVRWGPQAGGSGRLGPYDDDDDDDDDDDNDD